MNEDGSFTYAVTYGGRHYSVEAPSLQLARDGVALRLGIGREICSCGLSFWGEVGVRMHTGEGHGEPTLEQVDGYFANVKARNTYALENTDILWVV